MLFGFIGEAAGWSAAGGGNALRLRLLRMLRIMKLARIVRASRILSRWQDHIGLSYAHSSLLRFMMMTLVLAHWLACLWGFVGLQDYLELSSWEDSEGPIAWGGYLADQSWRSKASVLQAGPWDHYGMALYVALNAIFGGSCEINPANFIEFYTQSFMLIIGSSVWAYVIGSACGVIATLDPALVEYRQTLDELNYFVKDQAIPPDLAIKLRSCTSSHGRGRECGKRRGREKRSPSVPRVCHHSPLSPPSLLLNPFNIFSRAHLVISCPSPPHADFRNTMYLVRAKRYDVLLQKMSTRLRGDAAYRMSMNIFGNVPYLIHPDLESEFMCNLAIRCKSCGVGIMRPRARADRVTLRDRTVPSAILVTV